MKAYESRNVLVFQDKGFKDITKKISKLLQTESCCQKFEVEAVNYPTF